MMKINNKEVKGLSFAYDGCHKIYIIEDDSDKVAAKKLGYQIYNIKHLKSAYENSCSLKFISNWKLDINYVNQFEEAIFEDIKSIKKGGQHVHTKRNTTNN